MDDGVSGPVASYRFFSVLSRGFDSPAMAMKRCILDNKAQFVDLPFEEGFYRVIQSRSGSYWSDYEYSDPVVSKVEPYTETVTITKYRAVE